VHPLAGDAIPAVKSREQIGNDLITVLPTKLEDPTLRQIVFPSERHARLGPRVQNPSGFRFLRRFRLARTIVGDRLANERLEGGLVNFFSFVDVDRAACVSLET
jgi:hypothetical protein